jgi:hypothetical protein
MLALALAVPACSAADDGADSSDSEDLTSLTARSRTLKFSGVVFVSQDASDSDIVYAIDKQTQSAFGALRTSKVGVNTRELKVTDEAAVAKTFVKTKVDVIDTSKAGARAQPMLRVAYTYTDQAVVPKPMATRSALTIALLGASYQSQVDRVTSECTANDSEAHEFASALWYVFDPSQDTCKTAMTKEQQGIDADRAKLTDQKNQVALSEVNRLYIPSTAAFTASPTNTKLKYPEYDQLYSGKGVEDGKLVIGMVSGLMADWAAGEHHDTIDDEGYDMWFQGLREIMTARPGLKLVSSEPAEDFTKFKVGTKTVSATDFNQVMQWELDGTNWPAGLSTSDQHALRVAVGNKIAQHWLTFEVPTTVTLNGKSAPLTIKLQTYFGASEDSTPHKRAIKTSDVFIYNGHSYIGYGPLDPTNFTADDFPKTYQILVMNGCVSYNYYEHDFFGLKGGTKNVELITNGLESWVNESGPAMGRLAGSLIDGKFNSYQDVLKAAQFQGMGYDWGQDALRVVDGELDNKFDPKKVSISVK